MAELNVGIAGCAGRMGTTLLRAVADSPVCAIAGGSEVAGHAAIGAVVGELAGLGRIGRPVTENAADLFAISDAVIDFTVPANTVANAAAAAASGKILVAGTTGLTPDDEAALATAAKKTAVVYAANMSVGVNVLFEITRQVAALLPDEFDIEITEMHHRRKVDAPSGTALALGRAAALGRGVDLDDVAARGRDGQTGARRVGDIGFAVLRGGNVVGEHTVIFASDNERVELTHRAQNRTLFAAGAIRAALWARGKPPGLYSMKDVLGLG